MQYCKMIAPALIPGGFYLVFNFKFNCLTTSWIKVIERPTGSINMLKCPNWIRFQDLPTSSIKL
jgi:hypothetical protein